MAARRASIVSTLSLLLAAAGICGGAGLPEASGTARPLPAWFGNAKFGIFVHWGLFSVPGWAERTESSQTIFAEHGPRYYYTHNPYAEWYWNTIQVPLSAASLFHAATYGSTYPYDGFRAVFNEESDSFDAEAWAELFKQAGARYMVLTTKHHEGFQLWPSTTPNPHKPGYQAGTDLVEEVTTAMRAHGLRMGLYYSGGYDWTWNPQVITGFGTMIAAIPRSEEYGAYVVSQYTELIDRYHPDVLWNDIVFPPRGDLAPLIQYYYQHVPEGVVNDRFFQPPAAAFPSGGAEEVQFLATMKALDALAEVIWPTLPMDQRKLPFQSYPDADFTTPEYGSYSGIVAKKWEATRGIGNSFGNNRHELPEDMLSVADIVHMLVDVVSKNGNLLLGVGAMPDGTIPSLQRQRLLGVGAWLEVNGEAIYDTTPWLRPSDTTPDGVEVRYTTNPATRTVYAVLLGEPTGGTVELPSMTVTPGTTVTLLGGQGSLAWEQRGTSLRVTWPTGVAESPAHALAIVPPASQARRHLGP
jgi:alpha-L-fucosidase